MTSSPAVNIQSLAEQAYAIALGSHGNLDLPLNAYVCHIVSVVEKHHGPNPTWGDASRLFHSLHTNDIFVSVACARSSESAWRYFINNYRRYLYETARACSPNIDVADEVVDHVLSDLSLPNRSGRPRMASYDGRSTLTAWLRVIVVHQASKERKHFSNIRENIDSLSGMADENATDRIEAEIREHRYYAMVRDSLRGASQALSESERLILLLRYDEGLQAAEIARILRVSRPTVTRYLQAIYQKLRDEVVLILASKYGLSTEVIEECLIDIRENPAHSFLSLVKQPQ